MKARNRRQRGKGATELIEEAIHLLRTASTGALVAYFVGTLPFLLGLLFFWTDMSRNPFAPRHVVEAALGMTVLLVWMKFWQSVFAGCLRAQVAGLEMPKLTFSVCRRILVTQTAFQPSGLYVLPVMLVLTIPFPWACTFYQNLTVLAMDEPNGLRALAKRSWRQAKLWPGQHQMLLTLLSAFGLFVFLNWSILCYLLPSLAKMLFGVESAFSRGGLALLNTTFFAAMLALTHLCVDPILKAACVLRCFYGESIQSGEDLKAELKQFAVPVRQAAAALVLVMILAGANLVRAADSTPTEPAKPAQSAPAQPANGVSAARLDKSISETIQERKYTWRLPREEVAKDESAHTGIITRFFENMLDMIKKSYYAVTHWINRLLRRLFSHRQSYEGGGSGFGWVTMLDALLYVLLAAVAIGLALLLMRMWRERGRVHQVVATEAIQPAPDLTDENVSADQLPEDGWTRLARELLTKGEWRLALRAFYLASLAHLAGRNLISLARFKSNHDYERELSRRAHALPDLLSIFGDNVQVFDRIWYGTYEVTQELVNQFASNVDRIKAGT